jgi:hypothetical protein
MQDKLNQFISNLNGQFVEVSDSTNANQCMDLAYNWVFALGFPKATIRHLYAYQVYTEATDLTRQYFDLIPNSPDGIPEDGDIVVFNKTGTNIAGHIGIALGGGTTSKFKMFDQNKHLKTPANVEEQSYTNCLGWLRPKLPEGGIPQWLATLLQESGLTIANESEIRSIIDKGKKYDTDTKSLYTQLITANETISAKSQELAIALEDVQKYKDKATNFENDYNETIVGKNAAEIEKTTLTTKVGQLETTIENQKKQITVLEERIKSLEKDAVASLTKRQLFWLWWRK